MEPREMHARSQAAFGGVLELVTDEQLGASTPCSEWDVAALVAHVVDANRWVVKLGGGERVQLPDDVRGRHAVTSAAAQAVFDADGAMTRTFDLPWGPTPGAAFAATRANDVYAHAWDLATAIGADTDLDPELGEALYAVAQRLISPEFRSFGGFFGTEHPCDSTRTPADRLAAFLGRTV
jgi:uncharacterized protein (TIGR03086 family)